MAFFDRLQRASWRGVPFAVENEVERIGRRMVEHVYPYRDTVWEEDLGELPPQFTIVGFIVENSLIYGGGEVIDQRNAIRTAAQAKGQGILVHPIYGRLTVNCLNLVIKAAQEEGCIFRLEFNFVQGGASIFPELLGALGDLVGGLAGLADAAGLSAFGDDVLGPLQSGISAAQSIAATAAEWVGQAQTLARDATSLYGTVSQLGGADFGRYFNGRNAGFVDGLSSPYAAATSVSDLINLGAANRAAVATSAAGITAALSTLGIFTTPADIGRAIQATVAAVQASAADPADGVRILTSLAAFTAVSTASRTPAGIAVSDIFQRAATSAAARVSAAYAPASADDAHLVRDLVLAPINDVVERAGDLGRDDVFQAFRSLRKGVVDDLGARGAALPRLVQLEEPANLPDVVLAQRLYADASRADELVTEADPIHPFFMPRAFTALAS